MSVLGILRSWSDIVHKKLHTGNEAQAGQEDVDEEVGAASSLQVRVQTAMEGC